MEFSRQEYWSAISFSRRSSQPRDLTWVSGITGRLFTIWATREAHHLLSHGASLGRYRIAGGIESACNAGNPGLIPSWSQVRKILWRREWLPTPVFLPGVSHGQRSLAGYSAWGSLRVGHGWATSTFTEWYCLCYMYVYIYTDIHTHTHTHTHVFIYFKGYISYRLHFFLSVAFVLNWNSC